MKTKMKMKKVKRGGGGGGGKMAEQEVTSALVFSVIGYQFSNTIAQMTRTLVGADIRIRSASPTASGLQSSSF